MIRESGYVPNNSARNLKRADARAVALLVKGMDNMFFTDIIHIIERDTQEQATPVFFSRWRMEKMSWRLLWSW